MSMRLISCQDGPKGVCKSILLKDNFIKCMDQMYVYDHDLNLKQTIPHRALYISKFIYDDMFFTHHYNLNIWDANTMQNVYTVDNDIHMSCILDESSILMGMKNLMGIVDLRIGKIMNSTASKATITSLFTKNENELYCGDLYGHLLHIDKRTMKPIRVEKTESAISAICYKEHLITQGNELIIWGDDDKQVHFLSSTNPLSSNIYDAINFIKEYLDYIIVPLVDGDIGIYNTTSNSMTRLDGHYTRITSLEILDKIHTHSLDGIHGVFEWLL